jgi:probable F420-dependent oxidoreductase
MRTVRIGLALENFAPHPKIPDVEALSAYARRAEKLGFDSLWAWDHILLGARQPFPFLESLSTLAALSMITRTVSLGTGVLVLPLRNPVVLAKTTSTLDRLSGGRLMLGVAAGWYEREFEACGIPFKQRGKLFEQGVEVLDRFWSGEPVDGQQDGMLFRRAVMSPPPQQRPRPPLLFGGYVDRVLRRVARLADGWLTYFYTPESFRRAWTAIRGYAHEEGRDPDALMNVAQLPFCVGSSYEAADGRVRDFVAGYFDVAPWSESTADSAIRGTPDQCLEQLHAHVEAGVQHIVLVPCDYDGEQVEAIADHILPRLRGAEVQLA